MCASSPRLLIRRSASVLPSVSQPDTSREQLAMKLRHNWAVRDMQVEPRPLDGDLTNLGWLQNMNLMKLTPPTPPASPQPSAVSLGSEVVLVEQQQHQLQHQQQQQQQQQQQHLLLHQQQQQLIMQQQQEQHQLQQQQQQQQQQHQAAFFGAALTGRNGRNQQHQLQRTFSSPAFTSSQMLLQNQSQQQQQQQHTYPHHHHHHHHQQQQVSASSVLAAQSLIQLPPSAPPVPPSPDPEFAVNSSLRPPYSFSTLIYMALTSLTKSKMSLQEICNWIGQNFAFYGCSSDQNWQSAVRYNLTLNRCFQRVPRRKDEAGNKGGYWRLNPDHVDSLDSVGTQSPVQSSASASKRHAEPISASEMASAKSFRHQHHQLHLQQQQQHRPSSSDQARNGQLPSSVLVDAVPLEEGEWMALNLDDKVETQVHDPTLYTTNGNTAVQIKSNKNSPLMASNNDARSVSDNGINGIGVGGGVNGVGADSPCSSNSALRGSSRDNCNEDEQWLFEPDDSAEGQPALDMSNPDSLLDLTLHGMALNPPTWWSSTSHSGQGLNTSLNGNNTMGISSTPSPILRHEQEEWVDENLDVNALDNLLGLG